MLSIEGRIELKILQHIFDQRSDVRDVTFVVCATISLAQSQGDETFASIYVTRSAA